MHTRRTALAMLSLSSLAAALLAAPSAAAQVVEPAHLTWAVLLVDNILPEHNEYGTNPHYVYWEGVNGATRYENRTQCNSLLTRLLMQAYGWSSTDIRLWLGSTSPSAALYHDAIAAENGWDVVPLVSDVEPGDVLAIRYPSGGSVSGHVATVVEAPALRTATVPFVPGTLQFEVLVVDSTGSAHGDTDTRRQVYPFDTGVGEGVMRLYTDDQLQIVGHTWSLSGGSVFYDQATRHAVIGRLAR